MGLLQFMAVCTFFAPAIIAFENESRDGQTVNDYFGIHCAHQCDVDHHCGYGRKCCNVGCGRQCLADSYAGPLSRSIFLHSVHEAEQVYARPHMRMSHNIAAKRALAFHPPDYLTRNIAAKANILVKVSAKLGLKEHISKAMEAGETMERLAAGSMDPEVVDGMVKEMLPGEDCTQRYLECNPETAFRTLDGRCNNLYFPHFGASHSPFRRYLPPAYNDGYDSPRSQSVEGGDLPSARLVSDKCHDTAEIRDRRASHMLMQWGQFLDHDLTLTPESMEEEMSGMDTVLGCEECDSATTSKCCFPIHIPEGDKDFEPGKCIDFKRSSPGQLSFGPREQINAITAYIDASNVYGADINRAAILREGAYGKMKVGEDGLMFRRHEESCKAAQAQTDKCFMGGDVRVNVQSALTSCHTMWVHQHNKIAEGLGHLNPHWGDGRLYQEARKIVGAQHQWITYNEWLPKVLGPALLRHFGLESRRGQRYNPHCEASISNSFATAALRFGHTLIRSVFNKASGAKYDLFHQFFKVDFLDESKMDGVMDLMEGLGLETCNAVDPNVASVLVHDLFASEDGSMKGLDLVALNIQRGRDHGLPGWIHYRKVFRLPLPTSWDDIYLMGIMNYETVQKFSNVYKSIYDVDLFPGLLAEVPRHGAMVGPTLAAILGDVFRRLKYCDRFWFQWGPEDAGKAAFSQRQIYAIMDGSVAKVMCDHVTKETHVPLYAFEVPDHYDQRRLRCLPYQRGLVSIDLSGWREAPAHPRHNGFRAHDAPLKRRKRQLYNAAQPHGYSHPPTYGPQLLRIPIPPRCYTRPDPGLVFKLGWF